MIIFQTNILVVEVDADIYHFHNPELLSEGHWIKKGEKDDLRFS